MKKLFVLFLFFSLNVSQAQLTQIKPCQAKEFFKNISLPPDTEIIQVMGHKFRIKDNCVPFDITMTWKEHYNNAPQAEYDINYTQVFSGELWYKKDAPVIAFAANPMNWSGTDRLISFSASGKYCRQLEGETCKKKVIFENSNAIPSKFNNLSAGGSISFATPAIPNVVDVVFNIGRVDFKFKKNDDYANPGMTWINNLNLNPFKYDAIVNAIEDRQDYTVTLSYNGDNDIEDSYPYSSGSVKMKFNFRPDCPHRLSIESPTKKQFSFDSSSNPKITITAKVNDDFPEEHVDKITWSIPEKEGSQVSYSPANKKGRSIEITYSGLPKYNKDFGETIITAKAYIGSICGELKAEKKIYLFFDRDASNNPKGLEPNWYYYWQQTSAGNGTVADVDIKYNHRNEGCANPKWLGYHPIDKTGTPNDYLEKGRSYIYLCDFHKYDNIYANLPSTNFLMTALTVPGKMWEGIDTFGEIVKHELKHRSNMNTWWSNGWPSVGWIDSNNNGNQDPNELLLADMDHDYIPDNLEQNMGYDKTKRKTFYLQFPQDFMWDEHHFVYKWAENGWQTGSADKEDWANPGKQWFDE
jgi:hypothetical protein